MRSCTLPEVGFWPTAPADPSVILDLEVSFKRKSAGREVVVEVLATDDNGGAHDFLPAGHLTVLKVEKKNGKKERRREDEE